MKVTAGKSKKKIQKLREEKEREKGRENTTMTRIAK